MREEAEQRRGEVEKEAGFWQREIPQDVRAGNDYRDEGLFGNPDDWQVRQVMEILTGWKQCTVGKHLKVFKSAIHRNCRTPMKHKF